MMNDHMHNLHTYHTYHTHTSYNIYFQSITLQLCLSLSQRTNLTHLLLHCHMGYAVCLIIQLRMGQKQLSQKISEAAGSVMDHPKFKQARLLSDKQGQSIQIAVPVVNENELVAWEKGFKALLANDCLLLPLSFEFKRTQLCGANGICKIKFDNYPFLLRDEIANRRDQPGKPFQNEQLWYLALSLLQAGKVMHTRDEKVGDVQPCNVFINDNGQAKVACQYSWPHELDNYQKTVFEKEATYLAPEEIRDLHFGLTQTNADKALAQSFSIGLSLLDSALLTDSRDLYSLSAFRIDYQKLDERRLALQKASNVDEVLRQIVLGLTEVDPKGRLNCSAVFQWMEKYREHIVNMEGFQIRELPPWMRQQGGERKNLPILKPPTQAPFYVEARHFQPIIYEEPRIIQQRILQSPPPPQWQPPPPIIEPSPQPYRFPVQSKPLPPVISVPAYPQQVGVYESNYVQVPTYAPSISKSDDFKSTLQKIEEQLAVSRKMFPN